MLSVSSVSSDVDVRLTTTTARAALGADDERGGVLRLRVGRRREQQGALGPRPPGVRGAAAPTTRSSRNSCGLVTSTVRPPTTRPGEHRRDAVRAPAYDDGVRRPAATSREGAVAPACCGRRPCPSVRGPAAGRVRTCRARRRACRRATSSGPGVTTAAPQSVAGVRHVADARPRRGCRPTRSRGRRPRWRPAGSRTRPSPVRVMRWANTDDRRPGRRACRRGSPRRASATATSSRRRAAPRLRVATLVAHDPDVMRTLLWTRRDVPVRRPSGETVAGHGVAEEPEHAPVGEPAARGTVAAGPVAVEAVEQRTSRRRRAARARTASGSGPASASWPRPPTEPREPDRDRIGRAGAHGQAERHRQSTRGHQDRECRRRPVPHP